MTDLKTCPFCGTLPVLRYTMEMPDDFPCWHTIHCDECGIEIGDEYEDAAIAAWNRRAPVKETT
ncbi:MAG: Restriction alleviation protein Lar [Pseudomonadota bacterium]